MSNPKRSFLLKKVMIRFLCINTFVWGSLVHAAEINRFRHAEFGASEAILRQKIAEDFNISDADISALDSDVCNGTKTLEVKLPKLDLDHIPVAIGTQVTTNPRLTIDAQATANAPLTIDAPVTISYILGYRCRCLIQVNIVWTLPEKITTGQRNNALSAIKTLSDLFSKQLWNDAEVFEGRIFGKPEVKQITNYIFFRAMMSDYTAVTVWGAPVMISGYGDKGASPRMADTSKLKTLAVTYELNTKRPDLMRHPDLEKCPGRRAIGAPGAQPIAK